MGRADNLSSQRLTIRHIRKLSFTGLKVFDAMRLRVVHLEGNNTIEDSIRQLIKHKVAATLIVDPKMSPLGVVSKTELISAYYGELPLEMMLQDIMTSPVLCCATDDSLEDALSKMQDNGIHRLYVVDVLDGKAVGTLAYPDIVGLLYRYCHICEFGLQNKDENHQEDDYPGQIKRLKVSDVMTYGVKYLSDQAALMTVIEELAMSKIGAMLLVDEGGIPSGVISKTDLTLAYKRGVPNLSPATEIMSTSVHCCREDESLENAIRKMIHSDLSRLFVYKDDPTIITGLLALSDAARARSGSCQACASSRIIPNPEVRHQGFSC